MLSAYEQQRQANIARNKRALQLLGLDTGILPREKKTKKRQRRKASPRASTRRSTRVAKQPAVDYSLEKVLDPANDDSGDNVGDDADDKMYNPSGDDYSVGSDGTYNPFSDDSDVPVGNNPDDKMYMYNEANAPTVSAAPGDDSHDKMTVQLTKVQLVQLTKVQFVLLTLLNELQSDSNVRWTADGGSFGLVVSKGQEHFEYDGDRTKVESFTKQLRNWGFKTNNVCYHNPLFHVSPRPARSACPDQAHRHQQGI